MDRTGYGITRIHGHRILTKWKLDCNDHQSTVTWMER